VKEKAIENAKEVGDQYLVLFLDVLKPIVPPLSNTHLSPANHVSPRVRSRSLVLAGGGYVENAVGDDLCGRREAKFFDNRIYFGTDVEKMKGAVFEKQPDGMRIWQAVWIVGYDDGDMEQLSRVKVVAAMRLHGRHINEDTSNVRVVANDIAGKEIMEIGRVDEEFDVALVPMVSTRTQFLDPR